MRSCPICQARNRDEATVCFYCGHSFLNVRFQPDNSTSQPTQPVRVYKPYAGQAPYGQDSSDYDQTPEWQPPDPEPPPAESQPPWALLIGGLSLLLIVALGMAIFTWLIIARNGAAGLAAQNSNQPGPGARGAESNDLLWSTPSPWPTFTPSSRPPLQRSVTPNAAQNPNTNKLLSTECKGSLDQLSSFSDQLKNDPLKVLDETWRQAVDRAAANMKTNCGSLDSASPIPGELGQVQKLLNQASGEFDLAKLLWNQSIDQHDPSKAISAAQHVGEATTYLQQAISQLQKIIQ